MEQVVVSLIVPVYDIEAYLPECLASIRAQSFPAFEAILVDDGSRDRSGEICDAAAAQDSRFRVIHQPHGGLSAARNAGLQECRGKYSGFVDGDDWIEAEMLRRMVEAAEKNSLEIVSCDLLTWDETSRRPGIRKELCAFSSEDEVVCWRSCRDLFALLNNVSVCNKLFSSEFLRRSGAHFAEKAVYEDILFWSDLLFRAQRIGCVGRGLYHYRTGRPGSLVQQKDFRPLVRACQAKREALAAHGALTRWKDDLIAACVLQLVYCFLLSRPGTRKEFYCGMQGFLRQCGGYTFQSRQSLLVRFLIWLYAGFSRLPCGAFAFFCLPFSLLRRRIFS